MEAQGTVHGTGQGRTRTVRTGACRPFLPTSLSLHRRKVTTRNLLLLELLSGSISTKCTELMYPLDPSGSPAEHAAQSTTGT